MGEINTDVLDSEPIQIHVVFRSVRDRDGYAFSSECKGIFKSMNCVYKPEICSWVLDLSDSNYQFTEEDIEHFKWLINMSRRKHKNWLDVEIYKNKKLIRRLSQEMKDNGTLKPLLNGVV